MKSNSITEGKILPSLLGFAIPIFLTTLLQFLYGMVDMFVVSRFASTAEASGVTTGSMIMTTFTYTVTGIATGVTVLIGRKIGERDYNGASRACAGSIVLFSAIALSLVVAIPLLAESLARLMDAPKDAFDATVSYIRITGLGSIFILFYNLLGGIFRGLGDSKTPLVTVSVAAVFNLIFDILLVKSAGLGAAGAAIATVVAQALSVFASLLIIKRRKFGISLTKEVFSNISPSVFSILRLGLPVAVQNLLSSSSYVAIQAIINGLGLACSVAAGIGDKVGGILILAPAAYIQAISVFTAQNLGAKKPERAKQGLLCGILTALVFGITMNFVSIFFGDFLTSLFTTDAEVIRNGHLYIAGAYGFDCTLLSILFCLVGYFNGHGKTSFSLIQGIFGAYAVRIPYAFFARSLPNTNIFFIGLAAPVSSFFQILLCLGMFIYIEKHRKEENNE